MHHDDQTVLLDIQKATRLAIQFVEHLSQDAFYDDVKTQSAVLHQLLILGEATKRLSREFRKEHPDVPWQLMAGMRDHLIHGYDAVDLEEVWNIVQRDLPSLLTGIDPFLPKKE